jgi:O-antigen/teichoic acid export membrane protein
MTPMLAILSLAFVFRPMTWSVIAYVQAVQRTGVVMISSLFRAVVVLTGVAVCGYLGGPYWACAGAGIGFLVTGIGTVVAAHRVTSLPIGAYLRAVARPLLPCVPMYLAVVGVARGLSGVGASLVASLAAQIVVGAIVYVAAAFVLVRPSVDELLRVAREAVRRRR